MACAVSDTFLNMWEPKQGSDGAVRVWMEYAISLDLWIASIVVGGALKVDKKCAHALFP